jgi:hypothetical protein
MNSFEKEFTEELEKCAASRSVDIPVIQTWNPSKIAPPEVHIAHGESANVPLESMNYQLRRSETFQQIGNLLGLTLSESVVSTISKQPIEEEKIYVWLFARWWFNTYAEHLLNPLTQRSTFYKERHDEFMALMRHMLEFQNPRRLTFRAALSAWFPESDILTKEDQSEDDDDESYSDSDSDSAPPPPAAVYAAPPPAAAVYAAPPPAAPLQTGARRLVLKGWGGSEGRSRTRRNRSN